MNKEEYLVHHITIIEIGPKMKTPSDWVIELVTVHSTNDNVFKNHCWRAIHVFIHTWFNLIQWTIFYHILVNICNGYLVVSVCPYLKKSYPFMDGKHVNQFKHVSEQIFWLIITVIRYMIHTKYFPRWSRWYIPEQIHRSARRKPNSIFNIDKLFVEISCLDEI